MAFPIRYKGFSAEISSDNSTITIRKPDRSAAGELMINDCREHLTGDKNAGMTINAAIRIARFVSEETQIPYERSTRLRGTSEDYPLMIPDEIIAGIGLLQAEAGVKVDGKPGGVFIKNIMKQLRTTDNALRLLKFMDESDNTNLTDHQGELMMPMLGRPQAEFYDYFRRLIHLRNGLWSDEPNITNILGIRRVKPSLKSTWDDVLVVCWKDADGTPHCQGYTGSTEPGNTRIKPTVPPQTYIVRAGYHKSRQPGGRGFRITARDSNNRNLRYDLKDGRGINFHPGGSTGSTKNMVSDRLPGGTVRTEAEFRKNMALVEIFSILSHWGFSPTQSSYKFLEEGAGGHLLRIQQSDDTSIVVKNGDQTRNIDIKEVIQWTADFWLTRKKDLPSLVRILQSIDPEFKIRPGLTRITPLKMRDIIKPAHIRGIVEKQVRHLGSLAEVDGKAGGTYLNILNGKFPDLEEQAAGAREELERLQELLKTPGITPNEVQYLKQLCFDTVAERAKLASANLATAEDKERFQVDEEVKGWSEACQVVFGAEQFYKFWMQVTGQALQTGQRQWYYTVLDSRSIK